MTGKCKSMECVYYDVRTNCTAKNVVIKNGECSKYKNGEKEG